MTAFFWIQRHMGGYSHIDTCIHVYNSSCQEVTATNKVVLVLETKSIYTGNSADARWGRCGTFHEMVRAAGNMEHIEVG